MRFILTLSTTCMLALALAIPSDAEARAKKVDMVDACTEIDDVFCGAGGSDVPDFISGFVMFNPGNSTANLTVMVKGSSPDTSHSVFLCPGAVSLTTGFTGCESIGVFTTNVNGHGSFHMEWKTDVPDEHAVVLNIPGFATVLANCGDGGDINNVPCTDGGNAIANSIQP